MEDQRKRLKLVLKLLKGRYRGDMHTFLDFTSPWQLLVATILSAQAQDAQVNRATIKLFRDHPKAEDYANMTARELYRYIKSIGLYKGKGKISSRPLRLLSAGLVPMSPGA